MATGPTLRARVEADGFRWAPLRMSRGSNAGIARRDDPDDDLRRSSPPPGGAWWRRCASRPTPAATTCCGNPAGWPRDVLRMLDQVRPDAVVVDHLAFATTLALRAAGRPFTTFVPGHPTQLPVGGEVYGVPTAWPSTIDATVDADALAALRRRGEDVRDAFTRRYNDALRSLSAHADPVADAFAAHGADVLYNSPAVLHPSTRDAVPARPPRVPRQLRPRRDARRGDGGLARAPSGR